MRNLCSPIAYVRALVVVCSLGMATTQICFLDYLKLCVCDESMFFFAAIKTQTQFIYFIYFENMLIKITENTH